MVELREVVILVVLMALVFGVVSEDIDRSQEGDGRGPRKPCRNSSKWHHFDRLWRTSSANPFLPTESTETTTTPTTESESTTLERAHWCRMSNGTHVALDQVFMKGTCFMCRCTKSRTILCDMVQCMPTYCVDDKKPILRPGQCCTQCDYDPPVAAGCAYNGTTFPHGAVVKMVPQKMQCWCHLGQVECRKYIGGVFEGWNPFRDGTVNILVCVGIGVMFLGLVSFCFFSLLFYFYFKRNPQLLQQIYDQYLNQYFNQDVNQTGWQPLEEEEQYEEYTSGEEKRLEAEQYQSEIPTYHVLPPPYALYNDSETDEQKQKL